MRTIDALDRRQARPPARPPAPPRSGTRPPAQQQAEVLLAERGRRRRGGAGRRRRRSTSWCAVVAVAAHQGPVRLPRAGQRAHLDELAEIISDEHGKVLSDARGEVQRGLEVVEFACGIPQLLKGELLRPGLHRRRRVLASAQPLGVVRRASRRSTSRRWCRCGCTRWRSPAATPSCSSPASATRRASQLRRRAVGRGRPARRRVQRRARRQGGRRRAARPPGRRRGVVRRLDADRAATSTQRGTAQRQAGAGARRREEPRHRAARRRPRLRRRPPGRRRVRLGRASAAWRSRRRSRSAAPATRWSTRSATRRARCKVGPGRDPDSEMGPVVTAAAPRPDRRADRHRRASRAPSSPSTGAGSSCPATRTASSSARRVIDQVDTGDGRLPRGDLRPGAVGGARRHRATRRSTLINANPYGNGTAIFTSQRRGGAAVPARGQRRHDRHQRADPGADGLLLLRRLEGLAVRRQAHPRPGGRLASTPGPRSSPPAGRTSSTPIGASFHFPTAS